MSAEDVPDYFDHVKTPMDFRTMREKLDNFEYPSIDALEADFNVMVQNCLSYNERDTIFFRYKNTVELLRLLSLAILSKV